MSEETRSRMQAVAIGGVIVVLTFFLVQLMIALRVELAVIFLGFIIGITLAPMTEYGERIGIPRILSVLLLYLAITAALVGFIWWSAPIVAEEAVEAADVIEDLEVWYEQRAEDMNLPSVEELTQWGRDVLQGQIAGGLEHAFVLFDALLYLFMILVIAVFVTITKDNAYNLVLSLLPARRRDRAGEFMQRVATRLRRFVLGQLITMFAVGISVFIGLTIIGIPLAPLLAVIAFLFEIVPIIGPWLAFAPAFVVALTVGVWHAIAVAVLYFVIQQLESHVLVPAIQSKSVHLPGLLIVTAVLVSFPLLGVLGVLIAIPVLVIIHSMVHDILVPWRQGQVEETITGDGALFHVDTSGLNQRPADTEPPADAPA